MGINGGLMVSLGRLFVVQRSECGQGARSLTEEACYFEHWRGNIVPSAAVEILGCQEFRHPRDREHLRGAETQVERVLCGDTAHVQTHFPCLHSWRPRVSPPYRGPCKRAASSGAETQVERVMCGNTDPASVPTPPEGALLHAFIFLDFLRLTNIASKKRAGTSPLTISGASPLTPQLFSLATPLDFLFAKNR